MFPGVPPDGSGGGGHGSPSLRHDQFVGVVGENIFNREHLKIKLGRQWARAAAAARPRGEGCESLPHYSFTSVSYASKVLLCVRGGQRRNGQTKRFPLLPTVMIRQRSDPFVGQRGWMERGSHMLLQRGTIAADGRHARTVLHLSDASDYFSDNLCTLQDDLASYQITQTSPPHKCLGGHEKDDNG